MNIERLQQAAQAAGYAMAAPDDDADDLPRVHQKAIGTAVALQTSEPRATASASHDAVTTGATWLKNLLPAGIGGRATA